MQQQEITDFLSTINLDSKHIFLGSENNCFVYISTQKPKFWSRYGPEDDLFISVRELKDTILEVSLNPKKNFVIGARYNIEDFSSAGFTDFSIYFFRKGRYLLYGHLSNPKIIDKYGFERNNSRLLVEPSPDYAFDVFRTLPEIIADFDPDIEGIDSIEPGEKNLKKRLKQAKQKYYDNIDPPKPLSQSEDSDNVAEISFLYDDIVEGRAKDELLIPDVVRNLKSLKKILDEKNIPYNTLKIQESKLKALKQIFTSKGIYYKFDPVPLLSKK